jgi:hypothetical protein
MKKNVVLLKSGIIFVGLALIGALGTYQICYEKEWCINALHFFFIHFFPFAPLFFIVALIYKMRDEVYRAWIKFAYVWIPLSMIAIFLAPEYTNDWMLPITKGTVAFFSSALFILISLVIISLKYISLKRSTI